MCMYGGPETMEQLNWRCGAVVGRARGDNRAKAPYLQIFVERVVLDTLPFQSINQICNRKVRSLRSELEPRGGVVFPSSIMTSMLYR